MRLYVLRHGIAADLVTGGDDRSRPLTPEGRAKMQAAARGMKTLGVQLEAILTSPLVRARETAEIVAEVYGGQPVPRELPALATGVPPAETVRALRPFVRQRHVAIVGHEPGLSGLVSLLLTGSVEGMSLALKKGGLVALEVDGGTSHPGAALRWMLSPRHLRRCGR
jgi:phosphohistidine phosphatase